MATTSHTIRQQNNTHQEFGPASRIAKPTGNSIYCQQLKMETQSQEGNPDCGMLDRN
jgi:hypothetical protein